MLVPVRIRRETIQGKDARSCASERSKPAKGAAKRGRNAITPALRSPRTSERCLRFAARRIPFACRSFHEKAGPLVAEPAFFLSYTRAYEAFASSFSAFCVATI